MANNTTFNVRDEQSSRGADNWSLVFPEQTNLTQTNTSYTEGNGVPPLASDDREVPANVEVANPGEAINNGADIDDAEAASIANEYESLSEGDQNIATSFQDYAKYAERAKKAIFGITGGWGLALAGLAVNALIFGAGLSSILFATVLTCGIGAAVTGVAVFFRLRYMRYNKLQKLYKKYKSLNSSSKKIAKISKKLARSYEKENKKGHLTAEGQRRYNPNDLELAEISSRRRENSTPDPVAESETVDAENTYQANFQLIKDVIATGGYEESISRPEAFANDSINRQLIVQIGGEPVADMHITSMAELQNKTLGILNLIKDKEVKYPVVIMEKNTLSDGRIEENCRLRAPSRTKLVNYTSEYKRLVDEYMSNHSTDNSTPTNSAENRTRSESENSSTFSM